MSDTKLLSKNNKKKITNKKYHFIFSKEGDNVPSTSIIINK